MSHRRFRAPKRAVDHESTFLPRVASAADAAATEVLAEDRRRRRGGTPLYLADERAFS